MMYKNSYFIICSHCAANVYDACSLGGNRGEKESKNKALLILIIMLILFCLLSIMCKNMGMFHETGKKKWKRIYLCFVCDHIFSNKQNKASVLQVCLNKDTI